MLMWRNGLWLAVEVPVCPPGPAGLRPFTGALTRCAGKSQGTSALWGSSPQSGHGTSMIERCSSPSSPPSIYCTQMEIRSSAAIRIKHWALCRYFQVKKLPFPSGLFPTGVGCLPARPLGGRLPSVHSILQPNLI